MILGTNVPYWQLLPLLYNTPNANTCVAEFGKNPPHHYSTAVNVHNHPELYFTFTIAVYMMGVTIIDTQRISQKYINNTLRPSVKLSSFLL